MGCAALGESQTQSYTSPRPSGVIYLSKEADPQEMTTLIIPRAVYEAMRAHGEETYPHECCGALLARSGADGLSGREGRAIAEAVRAGNTRTDSAHNRYQIAPVELVRIEREARKRGLEIAGFYHSHPDHPAHWSATDFAEAHWIGCSYVITSVERGRATVTNSFLLAGTTEEDKRFEQEKVLVEDECIAGTGS
jgi:proteasome lid subunit RPN8/RPN11